MKPAKTSGDLMESLSYIMAGAIQRRRLGTGHARGLQRAGKPLNLAQPLSRARVTTIGGHARAYTPAKTVAYESTVALFARQAMGAAEPIAGPVAVSIVATWPIPPSWPKKRREAAKWKMSKPDADNVAKAIGDACNGIVWADDSQVVDLRCQKLYGPVPGVVVEVTA